MVALYFDQRRLPRSMTRSEWKDAWRKVRLMRQEIERNTLSMINALPWVTGSAKADLLDRIVNPPILMGPHMEIP